MEKKTLKRIFEFLEEKENHNVPFLWKHINGEPLTEKDLNIEGNLNLEALDIESLPNGLKVNGSAYFTFLNIKSIPDGFEVSRSLFLDSTDIESLPEGLKVGRHLYLQGSYVTSLPKGLEVGENLYIRDLDLEKYSDEELREMIKPGFIKGKIIR